MPSLVIITSTPRVIPATSIQPDLALVRRTGGRERVLPVDAVGGGAMVVAVVERTTTSAAAAKDDDEDDDDCDVGCIGIAMDGIRVVGVQVVGRGGSRRACR